MKPNEENKRATKVAKSMINAALNKAIFGCLTVSAATMREAPAIRARLIGHLDYKASHWNKMIHTCRENKQEKPASITPECIAKDQDKGEGGNGNIESKFSRCYFSSGI
jgi:hypothetical protein